MYVYVSIYLIYIYLIYFYITIKTNITFRNIVTMRYFNI